MSAECLIWQGRRPCRCAIGSNGWISGCRLAAWAKIGISHTRPGATAMAVKRKPALSPVRLLQLGSGFWGPRVFLSAVELGLFTVLAKGAMTEPALRGRLGLHQ